jgi:ribosomal protein L11 methylase PrmA
MEGEVRGLEVLDVGCGTGEKARYFAEDGALVASVPHPFRFALLKSELGDWGPGAPYQHTAAYRYPSPWKPEISLEHAMPRVSDYLNALTGAGLRLVQCEEPAATEDFRRIAPEKGAWMDRYVGIMIFRAEKDQGSALTEHGALMWGARCG